MEFSFDGSHGNRRAEHAELINKLVSGDGLPGKWGVLQQVLEVWTSERHGRPILVRSKRLLDTVGVLKRYHDNQRPQPRNRRDLIAEYLSLNGLTTPVSGDLAQLIYVYSKTLPSRDITFEGEKEDDIFLRTYQLPSGVEFSFKVYPKAELDGMDGVSRGSGPYVVRDQHSTFIGEVGQVIWDVELKRDLQLVYCHGSNYDASHYDLSSIGEPDDYISSYDDASSNLDVLAARCAAFQRCGITRKILFYGPPGTGKTTLARRLARTMGDGRTLRVEATSAENAGSGALLHFLELMRPKVLLFDDLDRCTDEVVEMMHYLEEVGNRSSGYKSAWSKGLVVVGTANTIKTLDPALLRSGRFDELVGVHEPGPLKRRHIIEHYAEKHGVDVDVEELTAMMDGFSPADVREVLQCVAAVGMKHLEAEVARVSLQRTYFSGDACEEYLLARKLPVIDDHKTAG